jgi:hypothetical protein
MELTYSNTQSYVYCHGAWLLLRAMRMRTMSRMSACGRIALIVLSFSRMCNFPKDSTGVTNFSTNVTFFDSTAGTVPLGFH